MNINIHQNRNLKHGGIAVILSIVLIASIILINVILTALQGKYGLYTDMTKEELFTLSDDFISALSDVEEPVNIIFCHDPDYIESDDALKKVYSTAKQIEQEFDWCTVKNINIIKEPTEFSKYKLTAATQIYTTSIIVESGNEFRIYASSAFFVQNEDGVVWAYNAEEKFAAAILSVTKTEMPVAYFTNNHGEEANPYLIELVANAGYDVRTIDLTREEIDEDARLVIINNPIYDFQAGNASGTVVSELEKIDKFLAGSYGGLMVFMDPDTGTLTNLEQYLFEWGIIIEDSVVRDKSQAVSTNGYALVAEYTRENTLSASLVKDIATLASPPKTIVNYASPITYSSRYNPVLNEETKVPTGAYSYYGNNATRDISAVLYSGDESVLVKDGDVIDTEGGYNLMVVSRETRIINNEYFNSYVLCAASSSFCDYEYIYSNAYANRDIMYSSFKQMGKEFVPAGIDFKVFTDTDIEDMTTAQANTWTGLLVCVIPSVCLIAGLVIVIRRRYL